MTEPVATQEITQEMGKDDVPTEAYWYYMVTMFGFATVQVGRS